METKKMRSTRLVIHHPRIPYTAVPAFPVPEGSPICAIELTGGFYRVLHIGSGITLTDTKGAAAAERFVKNVLALYQTHKIFKKILDAADWHKFCRHQNGKNEPECSKLFLMLEQYSSLNNNVPKSVTKKERYRYPSEPV